MSDARTGARILDRFIHDGLLGTDPEVIDQLDALIRLAHTEQVAEDGVQVIERLLRQLAQERAEVERLRDALHLVKKFPQLTRYVA